MSVIVAARAARRARRAQAGAPTNPLLHVDNGLRPDRPHNKCAKVVGEVMGTYHPHGDSAIYEALARMVQEFSLRHPLIDGHGSFGGAADDGPRPCATPRAAWRRSPSSSWPTSTRRPSTWRPTTTARPLEPVVLPARFPNLLVNGSQGIAVGMATNVPPHNMGEVIDAAIHALHHPEATPDELMQFVKGPDFPTGRRSSAARASSTPTGPAGARINLRAVAEIEEGRGGDDRRHRAAVPDLGRRDRREHQRARARRASSTASATCATCRPTRSRVWSSS